MRVTSPPRRTRNWRHAASRILNPLKEKVLKSIERVAKDEKYTFVFDQTEQMQILLYGDPNHDLTFKVIDRLKRGK